MKKLITLCLLLATIFTIQAQEKKVVCDCPEPKGGKFVYMCVIIENKDLNFKEAFEEMSCVDLKKDSKETVRVKVNCTWEKYYKEYGCDSTGFSIAQGNALKYAVNNEFDDFVDGMVRYFGININLKDPSDGKTLLDFVTDEIIRYKNNKNYPDKAPELQRIYNHYKNDLNALHSYELLSQHSLPYNIKKTKITLTNDILTKFEGKYFAEGYDTINIKAEDGKLFFSFGESAKYFELSPDSNFSFFRKLTPAFANSEFTFKFNKNTGKYDLILYQNRKNILTKRV